MFKKMTEQKLITELGLFWIMIIQLSKIVCQAPEYQECLLARHPAVVEQFLGPIHEQHQQGLAHVVARLLDTGGRDVTGARLDAVGFLERSQFVAVNVVILQSRPLFVPVFFLGAVHEDGKESDEQAAAVVPNVARSKLSTTRKPTSTPTARM